jgi:hypothetical protein
MGHGGFKFQVQHFLTLEMFAYGLWIRSFEFGRAFFD